LNLFDRLMPAVALPEDFDIGLVPQKREYIAAGECLVVNDEHSDLPSTPTLPHEYRPA
jgi:hypothetical protein